MRKITLFLFLILYSFCFAQEKYEYVIIPKKFEFFKQENQYNTNFLIKSFFEKEGFKVFYTTDELPEDLAKNRCLGLFANAIEDNSLLKTKIKIEIKDCFNKVIYESAPGESREKDFKTAYTFAFRQALSSMSGSLNFKHSESNQENVSIPEEEKPTTQEINEESKTGLNSNQLFAIPTATGYKLVDSAPKTILLIYKTSRSDVFIAEKDNIKGVLVKKNNGWFFEYYQNETLVSEKVEVKF